MHRTVSGTIIPDCKLAIVVVLLLIVLLVVVLFITILNIYYLLYDTYRQNVYLGKIPEKSPFSLQVFQSPNEHNVLQFLPGIVASSQGHYKILKPHQC